MRSRASARILRQLVAVALAGSVGGCSMYLSNEGDPAAPILVQGRIVDASGGGMSGAGVTLQVSDVDGVEDGESVPVVYQGQFSAGLDGAFTIRLAPTPELVALAARNGGFVNFSLVVFAGEAAPFGFPRELRDGTWAGGIPTFVFGPDGVTGPGVDPGVPAPEPAGS
jgi:hypothetical protein